MSRSALHGEVGLELVIVARQAAVGGEWELACVKLYGRDLPGAGEYTHDIILGKKAGQALWDTLPEAVQAKLLEQCAEEAEPEDDEDPPSREDISEAGL